MIDWHHLFGLGLTDYFTGSCYQVEMEKDLSIKKQRLDILIIEQESGSPISAPPDGLENLARHNLMSYKSIQQAMDAWTLDELLGHYVNYRKQISPSFEKLLPVEDFGLYAVSTRHPEKLAKEVSLELVKEGVYDLHWGSRQIRLIVLSEIPKVERNAFWLLFSGIADKVQYGASHYKLRQPNLSSVFNNLFAFHNLKGIAMSYTVEDYTKEVTEEILSDLAPKQRQRLEGLPLTTIMNRVRIKKLFLDQLSPSEVLAMKMIKDWTKQITKEDIAEAIKLIEEEPLGKLPLGKLLDEVPPLEKLLEQLPPEERLKGLPPEERLKGLPPEERLKGLPPEEFLKRLSREEIEAYLKKLSTSN
jgi:hypothetical protein